MTTQQTASRIQASTWWVWLVGAAVAVLLGVYGNQHQPSGEAITTLGFGSMIAMKVWLAAAAGILGVVQLLLALWMYGKLGRAAPPGVSTVHRMTGLTALLVSLPVAFHCLWSLGFQSYDTRVVVHSTLGCVLYGAFVTKIIAVHRRSTPGWMFPLAGGLLFTTLMLVVLTSSVWYFQSAGVPD
jgi:hypothetical protein